MTDIQDHAAEIAAIKARDADERRKRSSLDLTTLDALIPRLTAAQAEVAAIEALCGDLVSDLSHVALRDQARGGPSKTLAQMLVLATSSRDACDKVVNPTEAG